MFNIGATEEISIRELAERVISVTGSRSAIELTPYDAAYGKGFEDMYRRVPDIAKIRALTGWQPNHSLEDMIRDVALDAATVEVG